MYYKLLAFMEVLAKVMHNTVANSWCFLDIVIVSYLIFFFSFFSWRAFVIWWYVNTAIHYIYFKMCLKIINTQIVMLHERLDQLKKIIFQFIWFIIVTCSIPDTSVFLFFSLSQHYVLQGTIKTLPSLFHSENPFEHENITMWSMVSVVSSLLF